MKYRAIAATVLLLSTSIFAPVAHAQPQPQFPQKSWRRAGGRDISQSPWQSWQAPVSTVDPERLIQNDSSNSAASAAALFKSDAVPLANAFKDGKPIQMEATKPIESIESANADSSAQALVVCGRDGAQVEERFKADHGGRHSLRGSLGLSQVPPGERQSPPAETQFSVTIARFLPNKTAFSANPHLTQSQFCRYIPRNVRDSTSRLGSRRGRIRRRWRLSLSKISTRTHGWKQSWVFYWARDSATTEKWMNGLLDKWIYGRSAGASSGIRKSSCPSIQPSST